MSYERSTPPPDAAVTTHYASATDPPQTSRSFNTMSSPSSEGSFLSRIQIYSTQIPKTWITPICGAGAGVASGIVTCPLDVVKTKLQAQGGFAKRRGGASSMAYKGVIGTSKVIWREEGMRGMYRGLGPMLLGYLPTWAVYLTVYEHSNEFYKEKTNNWWLGRIYSSLTAGACSTILTNPIWVIKTRLMSQSSLSSKSSDGFRAPWHYTSTLDAARKMYASEGVRAFYSGLTPALLGLAHVAVQFPLYEFFKMKFTGFGIGEHPPNDGGSHWVGISAATFLSKVCASTATYPHEVLRTRLQTQQRVAPAHSPEGIAYRGSDLHGQDRRRTSGLSSSDGMPTRARYHGVRKTCEIILREEGWRAFYAGIGTNLIRAVPAAMTTMLTYEWLQKVIQKLQAEGERQLEPREAYQA